MKTTIIQRRELIGMNVINVKYGITSMFLSPVSSRRHSQIFSLKSRSLWKIIKISHCKLCPDNTKVSAGKHKIAQNHNNLETEDNYINQDEHNEIEISRNSPRRQPKMFYEITFTLTNHLRTSRCVTIQRDFKSTNCIHRVRGLQGSLTLHTYATRLYPSPF